MNLHKRDYGTVAGPHPRTAQAGFEMLLAGGNAVDAAVAAAFAEGVVEPSHNGIAGLRRLCAYLSQQNAGCRRNRL